MQLLHYRLRSNQQAVVRAFWLRNVHPVLIDGVKAKINATQTFLTNNFSLNYVQRLAYRVRSNRAVDWGLGLGNVHPAFLESV